MTGSFPDSDSSESLTTIGIRADFPLLNFGQSLQGFQRLLNLLDFMIRL